MTYKIEKDLLVGPNVTYHKTNKHSGKMEPQYLVLHYTAGPSMDGDLRSLTTGPAKSSAHLLVGEDGKIAQINTFTHNLWHAGVSKWRGINGLNKCSIGIEVCNPGVMDFVSEINGIRTYRTWWGTKLNNKEKDIIDAVHKNGGPTKGWQRFTQTQLEILEEVGGLLMDYYEMEEAVGHDMISPGRKSDPGPTMPDNIYSKLNGRTDDEPASWYVARDLLNVRSEPSMTGKILDSLDEDTEVQILKTSSDGEWYYVDPLDSENIKLNGWVYAKFIKRDE